jgi:hypothetical protein
LTNDSYIIDGTYTENSESYKILVKYDSSGQLLWNFQKNSIAPYLIAATRDGGFASVDFINNNLIKLEKYDSLNNVTELNEMILNYPFKANDIIQTSDNGYLITGVSLIDSMKNGVIYKINNLGLILKKIDAIDSNTNYKDIHQVNDNLYVINTQFNRHPGYILINSSGEILQKVPLKERYNEFSSVSVAYDSILFFTGQYHDGNCCIGIYWFGLSIDSHFLSVPEIPSQAETFSLHAFPNPFSNSITIEFFLPEPSPVKVSLYDIFGNEVDVIARNDYQQGLQRVEYSGSRLSQGMYYLRVQTGTMTATERIVLVK